MPVLITDDIGQPKPQYGNATGTGFETWRGASGHGNVRSDDGQIVSIGAKADPKVEDPALDGSVIALLKGILSKTGASSTANAPVGTTVWNDVTINLTPPVANPTVAPTLAVSTNTSTLPAGTYYVAYSWKDANGETLVSPFASITTATGQRIDMTFPALASGATSKYVYVGTSEANATRQATVGPTTWSIDFALAAGVALPVANKTGQIATSAAVDITGVSNISVFGNVTTATSITIKYSQTSTGNFYGSETITVPAGSDFVWHGRVGAKFVKLALNSTSRVIATIAGK